MTSIEQEKAFDYTGLAMSQIVSHIAKFVSGLWLIHPFGEGNTRTTAVFTIQYLRSLGFNVENDLFANYSWYFRNALVRANYQNVKKGITRTSEYFECFFHNLLLGEKNELKNRYMLIDAPEGWETSIPTSIGSGLRMDNENVVRLIRVIRNKQLSVREMIAAVGLKNRENFVEYSLNPAIKDGYVMMLYPDKSRHPRQRYLLTVKGLAFYYELSR